MLTSKNTNPSDHSDDFDDFDDQVFREAYQKAVNNFPVSEDFYQRTLVRMQKVQFEQKNRKVFPIRRIAATAASVVLVLGVRTAGYFNLRNSDVDITANLSQTGNQREAIPPSPNDHGLIWYPDNPVHPDKEDQSEETQSQDSSGSSSEVLSQAEGQPSQGQENSSQESSSEPKAEIKKESPVTSFFKSLFGTKETPKQSETEKKEKSETKEDGKTSSSSSDESKESSVVQSDKNTTSTAAKDPTDTKEKESSSSSSSQSQQNAQKNDTSSQNTASEPSGKVSAQSLVLPKAGIITPIAPGVTDENRELAWTEVSGSTLGRPTGAEIDNMVLQYNLFNIPKELQEYVGADQTAAWVAKFCKEVNGNQILQYQYYNRFNGDYTVNQEILQASVWAFIRDFNIPKEEVLKVYQVTDQHPYGYLFKADKKTERYAKYNCYITDAQVDALFSTEITEVMKAFVGYEAVYHNGNIYLYQWFETHSAEEYQKAGFTSAQIGAILNEWNTSKVSADGTSNKFNVAYVTEQQKLLEKMEKGSQTSSSSQESSSSKNSSVSSSSQTSSSGKTRSGETSEPQRSGDVSSES